MEDLQELKRQLTLRQKILVLLQKVLGLRTQLEKLQWEARARKIAYKYNIDVEAYIATIWCESNFNPKAVNRNKNGTIDYGICQFNDYWYRNVISPEEALHNPKKALHTMARVWEKGHADDWICYRNKKYISWLKP